MELNKSGSLMLLKMHIVLLTWPVTGLCCNVFLFVFVRLQVLLLSARNALLSRLVLAGRADAANSQRFARVAFGSFNPRTASNRSAELVKAAAEDMLQGSGVPELEERVLGFLFEAAAGLKLVAILDDMGRLMNEVGSGLYRRLLAVCFGLMTAQ
jgi:hypothetical protein